MNINKKNDSSKLLSNGLIFIKYQIHRRHSQTTGWYRKHSQHSTIVVIKLLHENNIIRIELVIFNF